MSSGNQISIRNRNLRIDRNVLYSSKESLNPDNFHYSISLVCFISYLYQNKLTQLFQAQHFDGLVFESGVVFTLNDFISYTGWTKRKVCQKHDSWKRTISNPEGDFNLSSVFDYELIYLMENQIKIKNWSYRDGDDSLWSSLKDTTTIVENIRINHHPKRKGKKVYFLTLSKFFTNSMLKQWTSINFQNINALIGRRNPPVHLYIFLHKHKNSKKDNFTFHYLQMKEVCNIKSNQISIVKERVTKQLTDVLNSVNDLSFQFSWGVNNSLNLTYLSKKKLTTKSECSSNIMVNNLRGCLTSFIENRGERIIDKPLSTEEFNFLVQSLVDNYPSKIVGKDPLHYQEFLKTVFNGMYLSIDENEKETEYIKSQLSIKINAKSPVKRSEDVVS